MMQLFLISQLIKVRKELKSGGDDVGDVEGAYEGVSDELQGGQKSAGGRKIRVAGGERGPDDEGAAGEEGGEDVLKRVQDDGEKSKPIGGGAGDHCVSCSTLQLHYGIGENLGCSGIIDRYVGDIGAAEDSALNSHQCEEAAAKSQLGLSCHCHAGGGHQEQTQEKAVFEGHRLAVTVISDGKRA